MLKSTISNHGCTTLICDCEGTAPINVAALKRVFKDQAIAPATQLCGKQLHLLEQQLENTEGRVVVACTHKTSVFADAADQFGGEHDLEFTNIREKAAWSKEAASAGPKIAALLAEASLMASDTPLVSMHSDGSVLIFGHDQVTVDAANQLSLRMDITLVLSPGANVVLPALFDYPVYCGVPSTLSGYLGNFEVGLSGLVQLDPASRDQLVFSDKPQDGSAEASLVLDLRGGTPLISAPEKRDGYFNPDPANPMVVQSALLDLVDMVGDFDKPHYVTYRASICAHTSNGIVGCSRCLDICPAGAIFESAGELTFDPYICAGCGSCAAVCPTGAVRYNFPDSTHMLRRLRMLSSIYGDAGGKQPCLLVHDMKYGEEMIATMARYGDGLPARVIPFAVNEVTQFGLETAFGAFAYGFSNVVCLVNPAHSDEYQGLVETIVLVNHVLEGLGYDGDNCISIQDAPDPDYVATALYDLPGGGDLKSSGFEPAGDKATLIRLALTYLHKHAPIPTDMLSLPVGAPFGTVDINTDGCTLCLSCVGACPTNALRDNPELPQLRFMESACIQCGLCKATCPESVIKLEPRYDFTKSALNLRTIKQEEPFDCVKCGKPFGSKSMIETMTSKLEGHAMFSEPIALERLKMCENCRVISITEDKEQPFFAGLRPKPRTTEDYLAGKYDDDDPSNDDG